MANLQVGVAGNGTVTVGAGASVHSPASNTLTLGTNGDERVRIDSSGRILQGSSTGRSSALMAAQPTYQLEGTSSNTSNFGVFCNSNGTAAGGIEFGKTRGTSNGGTTIVASGDDLGHISFEGSDGSAQRVAARINVQVDGTPGSSDMPGRIRFLTTPDGSATEVERVRITSAGKVLIGTTTPQGNANADDLVVSTSGHSGITIRSGTSHNSNLFFADGTSGGDEYRGWVDYKHNDNAMSFGTNAAERLRITSGGDVGISTVTPASKLHLYDSGSDGLIVQSPSGLGYVWAIQTNDNLANGTLAGELGIRGTNGVAISGNNGSACQVHINSNGLCLGGTGAANGLDDYEEGTWTPTVSAGTVSVSEAKYVKIGTIIHVMCQLTSFSDTSTANNLNINLPFSSINDGYGGNCSLGSVVGRWIDNPGGSHVAPYVGNNSSYMACYLLNTGNWDALTNADIQSSSSTLVIGLTYWTP